MPRLRVLVCGGRRYPNRRAVFDALDKLAGQHPLGLFIIEGGATGADSFAQQWRYDRGHPGLTYRADWKAYGQAAGPIRNQRMLAEGKPDVVLAFPGGRGTRHMLSLAEAAAVPVVRGALV